MASLPALEDVGKLSDRVWRVLGQNPGNFTLQGSNVYLVGTGEERILLDTGEGKESFVPYLEEAMRRSGCQRLAAILITHHHNDHLGGVDHVRGLFPDDAPPIFKFGSTDEGRTEWRDIRDGDEFAVDGAHLWAIHTPGHTTDHMAFYLEEEKALFTGDCVLGHGTTAIGDLFTYMESLRKLRSQKPQRLYPGHGDVVPDGVAKIDEYIAHRSARETQVLEALRSVATEEAVPTSTITRIVYEDLPANVFPAAVRNTSLVLDKLDKEGRVRRAQHDDGDRWKCSL
mmetsp:Transcript_27786/g.77700  ORF Transcript_27786/g.77700 Transcript_27786/m.77700 type:complete len:285 (+) Transcript_27786:64-918(+)